MNLLTIGSLVLGVGALRHRLFPRWVGCGLVTLAACGGEAGPAGVLRTDSAGIEIIRSPGTDRPLAWQVERLFALGGADEGPEAFSRVTPGLVGTDAEGNLYVLDQINARVAVFDADGSHLRSFGGRGGGPGEFRTPGSISVSSAGAVAVFDQARLVRFDPGGEPTARQPFPLFPPTPNRQRHFARIGDTTFVSTSTSPMAPGPLTQMVRRIVGTDTTTLARFPLPPVDPVEFEACGVSVPLPPVFMPEVAWDARAGRAAVAFTTEYSVFVFEGDRLARIVRREITPEPASRTAAIRHLGPDAQFMFRQTPCVSGPGEMVDLRGVAEVVPPIGTVFLGPSGELWVERFTVDRNAPAPIDVFAPGGEYIGTLRRPRFRPVILLAGDRVGVVDRDADDVERLAVLSIQR